MSSGLFGLVDAIIEFLLMWYENFRFHIKKLLLFYYYYFIIIIVIIITSSIFNV
jgi:hypothetical protein